MKKQWKGYQFDYDQMLSLAAADETDCYSLSNRDVQLVLAALDPIGWKTRWFSDAGAEIDQDLIDAWQGALSLSLMREGDCSSGSCPKGWRVTGTGEIESTEDGGVTWEEDGGSIYEPLAARDEPTDDEKRCLASANAAEVLRLTYVEVLEEFQESGTPQLALFAFSSIVALLLAAALVPVTAIPAINALINFTWQSFTGALAGLDLLSDDDWTPAFNDEFICVLYDASEVDAAKVFFDYAAVQQAALEMIGSYDAALIFWLQYMLSIIGADGLNAAGTTTSIEAYECDCTDIILVPLTSTVGAGYPCPSTILTDLGSGRWRMEAYDSGTDWRMGAQDVFGRPFTIDTNVVFVQGTTIYGWGKRCDLSTYEGVGSFPTGQCRIGFGVSRQSAQTKPIVEFSVIKS